MLVPQYKSYASTEPYWVFNLPRADYAAGRKWEWLAAYFGRDYQQHLLKPAVIAAFQRTVTQNQTKSEQLYTPQFTAALQTAVEAHIASIVEQFADAPPVDKVISVLQVTVNGS